MHQNPGHQNGTAEHMNQQIAHGDPVGAVAIGRKQHQGGRQGHDFPIQKQAYQVTGQGHTDRATGVDKDRCQLHHPLLSECEQTPGKCHDGKNDAKETAQRITPHQNQFVFEDGQNRGRPVRQVPYHRQCNQRQTEDYDGSEACARERNEERAKIKDKAGRDVTNRHNKCPRASRKRRAPWRTAPCPRT